jgi:hypothetical protein
MKSLIIAGAWVLLLVAAVVVWHLSRAPEEPGAVTPKDFQSVVVYDLDPRREPSDPAARSKDSHHKLNESELALFHALEFHSGSE